MNQNSFVYFLSVLKESICRHDFLEIYELDLKNKHESSQRIKYCSEPPEPRVSATNAVVLKLVFI